MTKAAKQTLANDIKLADNEEESVRARERERKRKKEEVQRQTNRNVYVCLVLIVCSPCGILFDATLEDGKFLEKRISLNESER